MGRTKQQRGGSAGTWGSSFYANTAIGGPGAISRSTLANIENALIFKPFVKGAVIPTAPSTGIIPTGQYLAGMPPAHMSHTGGGRKATTGLTSKNVAELRDMCNANGLSCKQRGKFLTKAEMVQKLKQVGGG